MAFFSLIQLRKAFPVEQEHHLITGIKRDINLLSKVTNEIGCEAQINALDISFDKNFNDVERLLSVADSFFYCDHHKADKLFTHRKLNTIIDTSAFVCTGLLVSHYLEQKYHLWAIASLFGDGLDKIAYQEVKQQQLSEKRVAQIKELGVLVNYNGYGGSIEDLHYHPADLFKTLSEYDSPLEVIEDKQSPFSNLSTCYERDLSEAVGCQPFYNDSLVIGVHLPNQAWSKRISGTFGNLLSKQNKDKAIVVVSDNVDGTLTISLRAPKTKPFGASELCSRYPSGGGRASAAGVNALELQKLESFVNSVAEYYASV